MNTIWCWAHHEVHSHKGDMATWSWVYTQPSSLAVVPIINVAAIAGLPNMLYVG